MEVLQLFCKRLDSHILVVSNEEGAGIHDFLAENGFAVEVAVTGADAQREIAEGVFDVALIDLSLPDMEGTALLNMFKRRIPSVRKILMCDRESLTRLFINGSDDFALLTDAFLFKPVEYPELLAVINEQLSKQAEEIRLIQSKITL